MVPHTAEPRRRAVTRPGVMADLRKQDDMHTLLAMLATLSRLLRPSRGLHAGPGDYLRTLRAEARVRRAKRVRRYAENPGTPRPVGPGFASAVPVPRRPLDEAPPVTRRPDPADYVPVVQAEAVQPPADIVRGYYRAHEARQRAREDRNRLGMAVLLDLSTLSA